MTLRVRLFAMLAGLGLLVVVDLSAGRSSLLRVHCGPTYVKGGYIPACRVELGAITRNLNEMLRARNRAIDPTRPYNRPLRSRVYFA
jgi:hypothetical protein